MKDKITVGVFLIFIVVFSVGHLFVKDKSFSSTENRFLNSVPKVTAEGIVSGDYTVGIDAYLKDHIIFRNTLIKNRISVLRATNITEENGVFWGQNDRLLLDYKKPDEQLENNLADIQEFTDGLGIDCTLLIVPTATEIYAEKLPKKAVSYSQKTTIKNVQDTLEESLNIVDATEILNQHKDEYIFFRTDQNWTMEGAYYGYTELCKGLNIEPTAKNKLTKTVGSDEYLGGLYSMAPTRGQKEDDLVIYTNGSGTYKVDYVDDGTRATTLIEYDNLKLKDKYSVFLDGNHSLLRISSNASSNENVLIIKDSYGQALIPFLCDNYSDIHVIDLRYYHDNVDNYIARNGITKIIFIYNVDFISNDDNFRWLNQ